VLICGLVVPPTPAQRSGHRSSDRPESPIELPLLPFEETVFARIVTELVRYQGPFVGAQDPPSSQPSGLTSPELQPSTPTELPISSPSIDQDANSQPLFESAVFLRIESRNFSRTFLERHLHLERVPLLTTIFNQLDPDFPVYKNLQKFSSDSTATISTSSLPVEVQGGGDSTLIQSIGKLSDIQDHQALDIRVYPCPPSERLSVFREWMGLPNEQIFSFYVLGDVSNPLPPLPSCSILS
jgi:hypothetical protein